MIYDIVKNVNLSILYKSDSMLLTRQIEYLFHINNKHTEDMLSS